MSITSFRKLSRFELLVEGTDLGLVFAGLDRCRYQNAGDVGILRSTAVAAFPRVLERAELQVDTLPNAAQIRHVRRMAKQEWYLGDYQNDDQLEVVVRVRSSTSAGHRYRTRCTLHFACFECSLDCAKHRLQQYLGCSWHRPFADMSRGRHQR
jgi:hypothetical protein